MDYTYSATVEQNEEGFFIDFPAFDGAAFADGDTLEEAAKSAATVLRLTIADYLDSGDELPRDSVIVAPYTFFTVEVSDDFIAESKCMTPSEAAEYLGISKGRVSQLLDSGVLETYMHGGRRLVTIASVNKRLANTPQPGRPTSN